MDSAHFFGMGSGTACLRRFRPRGSPCGRCGCERWPQAASRSVSKAGPDSVANFQILEVDATLYDAHHAPLPCPCEDKPTPGTLAGLI
jgi:hypothetical protein